MPEKLITNGEMDLLYCLQIGRNDDYCCAFSFIEELDNYQHLQMKHDQIYHHEIFVLDISRRMSHVALHLAKYLAPLSSFPASNTEAKRAFIDSFIMTVSASNLLGISLSKYLENNRQSNFCGDFISEYITLLSNLAKACEAADHQEDYPIRSVWSKSIQNLFLLLIKEAKERNIPLLEEALSRLKSVERKHPLYNILQGEA